MKAETSPPAKLPHGAAEGRRGGAGAASPRGVGNPQWKSARGDQVPQSPRVGKAERLPPIQSARAGCTG